MTYDFDLDMTQHATCPCQTSFSSTVIQHTLVAFSAWTLLVGRQEGHRPVKNGTVEVGTG